MVCWFEQPARQLHVNQAPIDAPLFVTTAFVPDLTFYVQELEEDPDMRKHVALFHDPVQTADEANNMDEDRSSEGQELEIPIEELLDDLQDLALAEGAANDEAEQLV